MDGQSCERALGSEDSARDLDLIVQREQLVPRTNGPPAWMLNDHFNELTKHLGLDHILMRPSPNWPFYLAEQEAGRLVYIVARNPASANPFIGYMVLLLSQHPHYSHLTIASDDLHYLMPFWRGQGLGGRMLDTAEKECLAAGARIFRMRARFNVSRTEHDRMYGKRGYHPADIVYLKDLTNVDKGP